MNEVCRRWRISENKINILNRLALLMGRRGEGGGEMVEGTRTWRNSKFQFAKFSPSGVQ